MWRVYWSRGMKREEIETSLWKGGREEERRETGRTRLL